MMVYAYISTQGHSLGLMNEHCMTYVKILHPLQIVVGIYFGLFQLAEGYQVLWHTLSANSCIYLKIRSLNL